jgi:predicted nuclease of predicted toxin-antitoxin system
MKILLDMNLSPLWVPVLTRAGFETVHWSMVGRKNAPDAELMLWAKQNEYVVFTHDLDFGDILAATSADAPSVIQVRTQNLHPDVLGASVVRILNQFHEQLLSGALIVIDEQKTRARILPIRR